MSQIYSHGTRDITRNLSAPDALALLPTLAGKPGFRKLHLFSPYPGELHDLWCDAGSAASRAQRRGGLLDFLAISKHRTAVSDELVASRTDILEKAGAYYGQWCAAGCV